MSGDDEERRELLGIFREESQERMANVSQSLEALAAEPGLTAPLDEVDRELHTIKGSARLLGFMGLGKFVHDLEGLSRAVRVDRSIGLVLLVEACDRLAVLVDQASAQDQDATDDGLHSRVLAATPAAKPAGAPAAPSAARRAFGREHDDAAVKVARPAATPPAAPAPAPPPPAAATPAPPPPPREDEAAEPAAASALAEAPPPPAAAAQSASAQAMRRPAAGPEITSGSTPPTARASTESGARGDTGRVEGEESGKGARDEDTVRVRTSRLQTLDEVVSDLSLTKLRLATYDDRMRRLLHSVEDGTAGPTEVCQTLRVLLHDYRNDTIQVHRSTQQLQQLAVDVRLRPVDHLFRHVPREARDLARRLGKDVDVRVQGRETEMDRVILDQLKSPLGHLIRNALDHGLETPEERIRKGKPAQGVLTVRAGQEGGQVAIHIEDDGAGVDPRRVRQIAVQRGLIDATSAEAMTDEEAVQLIFTPGFSTKAVATEISGRGVGMDAVRNCVEGLKGDVRVSSRVGEGTRTTIRLPLTLLISRVTFVRSSGQQFAIPTEQVHESVRLPADRVTVFAGAPAVVLGFLTVPLVRLSNVLGHRSLPDPPFLRVLVVRHGDDLLALVVEELLEERSVVVKPLGWPLDRIRFMSGAIHLASGEVALLLHVPDLFALAKGGADEPRATYQAELRRTVLVVDDSVVSRQMVGRCVEALGFDLITAQDGSDALRLLERVTPDLIVTDVEMPRLGGLGLARRIRQDERLKRIPIIIVSSRGGESDRQAGLEAGADAYLPKGEFNETSFRSMVDRLL